jgi:hypothetical protein
MITSRIIMLMLRMSILYIPRMNLEIKLLLVLV